MRRHLDTLKQKPEHIRQRVALGASVAITLLIGLIWLVTNAASGTFALSNPGSASSTPAGDTANSKSSVTDLLGAVGKAVNATSTAPALTVVDGGTTSTLQPAPTSAPSNSATVIPF